MKKWLSYLLVLGLFIAVVPAAQAENEITVNMNEDFESYEVGQKPEYSTQTHWMTDNGKGTIAVEEEEENQYLALESITKADDVMLVMYHVMNLPGMTVFRMRVRTDDTNGSKKFMLRDVDKNVFPIFEFGGTRINALNQTTGVTFTPGQWYNLEFRFYSGVGNTKADFFLDGERMIASKDIGYDFITTNMDFRFQIVPSTDPAGDTNFLMDDLYCYTPEQFTAQLNVEGREDVLVNEQLRLTFSAPVAQQGQVTLNGSDALVSSVLPEEDGSYLVSLLQPLEKNTKYTLGIENFCDEQGQPLNTTFSFKTIDTALILQEPVLEGGQVTVKVENVGSESESALLALATYQNGGMSSIRTTPVELESGEGQTYRLDAESSDSTLFFLRSWEEPVALAQEVPFFQQPPMPQRPDDNPAGQIVEENTGRVTIYGMDAGEKAGRNLVLTVTDPDGQQNYLNQTRTEEGGGYLFSFLCDGNSGTYTYKVSGLSQEVREGSYDLVSVSDKENFLQEINHAQTAEEAKACLEKYQEIIGFDFPLLEQLENPMNVFEWIIQAEEFTTVAQVLSFLENGAVVQAINEAADVESLRQVMKEYDAYIKLSQQEAEKEFSALEVKEQDEVLGEILNEDFSSMEEFHGYFNLKTLFTCIYRAPQYATVTSLIETYHELLGLDLTAYHSLDSKSSVAKGLMNQKFATTADLKKEFDRLVEEAEKSDRPTTPSGGGGGGGGGGGNSKPSGSNQISVGGGYTVPTPPPMDQGAQQERWFSDLDTVPWAVESIEALCDRGAIQGFEDGSFRPEKIVTREEFVKMLTVYLNLDTDGAQCSFTDVPQDSWSYRYIAAAQQMGIVSGVSPDRFGAQEPITRQDVAVILSRAAKELPQKREFDGFADVDQIADYALESVLRLYEAGLIDGVGDGSFHPEEYTTRAQAAKLIYGIGVNK